MATWRFGLALTLVWFCGPLVMAQKNEVPLITTTGQAEIKVVPDLVDLRFDVETRNQDLAAARKLQTDRMRKVLSILRNAGVSENETQTSTLQIQPVYQRDDQTRAETETIQFFIVSQSVTFTLGDLKKVPDVTAALLVGGANRTGEARLRTSQLRKHKDMARLLAVRAAKEKAQALAMELGVKVGKPHAVTELPQNEFPFAMNFAQNAMGMGGGVGMAEAGGGPAFEPGTITIRADIQVAFILE